MLGAINLKRKKTQKAVLQRKRIIGKENLRLGTAQFTGELNSKFKC